MGQPNTVQHLNQILDNIGKDNRLNANEKSEARNCASAQHAALVTDSVNEPALWSTHCGTALLTLEHPPEYHSKEPESQLGNIWSRRAFESSVARQLNCGVAEAKRIVALALMHPTEMNEDDAEELSELLEKIRLRDASECWLFQNPAANDEPYAGLDDGNLSCRLGLPYRVGEEYVKFALTPPADARRPSVLDVDWYFQQFWRPGGRTRAFCSNCQDDGLGEWIATPPSLDEAGGPIAIAVVVDGNPVGAVPYDVDAGV